MRKTNLILLILLLVASGATIAVIHLQAMATSSRDAELQLADLQLQMRELQDIPWQASPQQGGQVAATRTTFEAARTRFEGELAALRDDGVATKQLDAVSGLVRSMTPALRQVIDFAARDDVIHGSAAAGVAFGYGDQGAKAMTAAGDRYRARGEGALARALYGSAAAIALLFAASAFFVRRAATARHAAELLACRNHELLQITAGLAQTDQLTGLPNRRALAADLDAALDAATSDRPVVLALFDLDGFKQYNDTFGHPAGDALLARLGERLATTISGLGKCYRMGGDEFCVLLEAGSSDGDVVVRLAAAALSDEGEGFVIGCSHGAALLPAEATTPEAALGVADRRMYAHKASGRASARRQITDVLVQVIGERNSELLHHGDDVADLAARTAHRLGLSDQEVQTIKLAAELHDIGKIAIPDAILTKPGKLDDAEWAFMERHTVIGERIVLAAPSLAHTGRLIRASHERVDGSGYPDRLRGDEIPLGARIIAVCDAYDAMVCDRPYQSAMTSEHALSELRRCAGRQFDPEVVDAFAALLAEEETSELAQSAHATRT